MQWIADNSTFHSTIPEAADLVVATFYSIFGVCSLLGNGVLLYVSYEKRPELKPAEWLYGKVVCLVYAFCGVLFGICSLSTLTMLSTVCCVKRARREPWARSYTLVLFVLCYAVPCGVVLLCYGQILMMVRESRRAVRQHVAAATVATPPRTGNIQAAILKLSVAVCIGFFLAWSPYALVSMLVTYGHVESMPPMAFAVPAIFAKSSTLYNPLVYLLLKPNYRHLLVEHILARLKKCPRLHCPRRLSPRAFLGPCSDSTPCSVPTPQATPLGHSHCDCEHCRDTFECFKHYPRCCHGNVNTMQLSLGEQSGPGSSRGPTRPGGGWIPGTGPPPMRAVFWASRKKLVFAVLSLSFHHDHQQHLIVVV
ncbi:hypothetical protein CRUP_037685 [Coryphaenoides rupestris]|nr:hypothetical protein CRUP_037685 [Coryphaenoides rupestris]